MLIFVGLLEIFGTWALSSENLFSNRLKWFYVYEALNRSRTDIGSDTLILGGSVARQIFKPNRGKNHLATIGSVYFAGNYILVQNVVENNPGLTCILYVIHPGGIRYDFDRVKTYSGFVKPFYTFKNIKYFDKEVITKIARHPLALLSIFNFFKLLPLNDFNYQGRNSQSQFELSDFSINYLKKISDFCKEKHIQLIFISPPLSTNYKNRSEINILKNAIKKNNLEPIFKGYFENMIFLPDSCFKDDVHLKNTFLIPIRKKLMQTIMQRDKL